MDRNLDLALCKDFPEIFRNRHADPAKTAMCWGFDCEDGWEPLIRATCERIMNPVHSLIKTINYHKETMLQTDRSKWSEWMHAHYTESKLQELELKLQELEKQIPVAVQVKEKFGGLRFYVDAATQKQQEIIYHAEAMSYYVCEQCGTMKSAQLYNFGWHKTLCDQHADEYYGSEAAEHRKYLLSV